MVLDFAGETEKLETEVATVTTHCAVSPLEVFAVMVAEPTLTAFTRPLSFTVATAVLELVQVTVLLEASLGFTVAVSLAVALGLSERVVLSRVTLVA